MLRLAGLYINTGTINEATLLARVVELAAPDVVCTDRPGELRADAFAAGAAPEPLASVGA